MKLTGSDGECKSQILVFSFSLLLAASEQQWDVTAKYFHLIHLLRLIVFHTLAVIQCFFIYVFHHSLALLISCYDDSISSGASFRLQLIKFEQKEPGTSVQTTADVIPTVSNCIHFPNTNKKTFGNTL